MRGGDPHLHAAGRDLKRKGMSSVTASPSMPAATGPSASTRKRARTTPARAAKKGGGPSAAATVIPSKPAIRGLVPEPTARPRR